MSVSLLDQWRLAQAIAADAGLSAAAARIAIAALGFQGRKSGRCNPSFDSLAGSAAMSRRHAMRAVQELETAGWIRVDHRGGRHLTNDISFAFERLDTVTSSSPFKDPETVTDTSLFPRRKGDKTGPKGCQIRHPIPKEEPSLLNSKERGGAVAPYRPRRGPSGPRAEGKASAAAYMIEAGFQLPEAS